VTRPKQIFADIGSYFCRSNRYPGVYEPYNPPAKNPDKIAAKRQRPATQHSAKTPRMIACTESFRRAGAIGDGGFEWNRFRISAYDGGKNIVPPDSPNMARKIAPLWLIEDIQAKPMIRFNHAA